MMADRPSEYDGWAWLYNRTMGPEYGREQHELLQRVLLPRVPAHAEILDLCCGTGQLIQYLVDDGYRVTGLDGSEEMLACARQNAPSANYILEDARNFKPVESFDAVFSTSASLNHVPSMKELKQVFENVYTSLRQGGLFVFDLNHPAQLTKWWKGRPTEGVVADDCSWILTPRYSSVDKTGAFRVTMYEQPKQLSFISKLAAGMKRPLYRTLSRDRFIGMRLKLLSVFHLCEPSWKKTEIDFPIVGHNLDAVKSALEETGFPRVELETIDGRTQIDDDHSAHFICSKAA